jgi:tetratricopeptide (TPR) repeat protein
MKAKLSLVCYVVEIALTVLTFGVHPVHAVIPEVEIERLQEKLATDLGVEERRKLNIALANAQLEAGEASKALKTLGSESDAPFLRARIFIALGRWDEALPLLRSAFETAPPQEQCRIRIAEAEVLRRVGNITEAIAQLEAIADPTVECRLMLAGLLLESGRSVDASKILTSISTAGGFESAWLAYLRGQLALMNDDSERASDEFAAALANPATVSEEIFAGSTIGLARARARIDIADGVTMLENYLREYPDSRFLADAFAQLDAFYAAEGINPSNPLSKWTRESPRRRAAYAAYYLARGYARNGRSLKALEVLQSMNEKDFDDPIWKNALILKAELLLKRGDPAGDVLNEAMRLAEDQRELGRIEMLAGVARFQERDYVQAAIYFHNAAEHAPELREKATFNAALAWLNQGNNERFLQEYARISSEFPESDLRRELILEQGLVQARHQDEQAKDTLERFLRDFPDNRRAAEARVALAEIVFSENPDNRMEAAEYLRVENAAPTDMPSVERSDYLSIYLEANAATAIKKARNFLEEHPESPLAPKVRMKLGELYSDVGDLANARTQLETVANSNPDSPIAEVALFLAGRAAARTMNPDRALELFEEVARRNGPFALYARQEQAALKSRLGQEKEAVILYDSILASSPPDALKYSAMIGKGDNLFILGGENPKHYEDAAEVFSSLARLPNVPLPWKNQALYKQGKALEKLGRPDEALVILARVMESGEGGEIPDTIWQYRAGFDAARILEARGRWKSAAEIYKSMAELNGPRSEEARRLLTQLRLKHFLWEENQ